MGKKSKTKRKSKSVRKPVVASATAPVSTASDEPSADKTCHPASPPGASCWICLEEGPDGTGPLARDCSCRGSAGFAHLSCTAAYAERKMSQCDDLAEAEDPWMMCPNCHQQYRNELAYDLATRRVSLAEEDRADDPSGLLGALVAKIPIIMAMVLSGERPDRRAECERIASELVSMIFVMKATDTTSPWPKEYLYVEGTAYNLLGDLALHEGTKESLKKAVEYFTKYHAICKDIDEPIVTKDAEVKLAWAKSKYEGSNDLAPEEKLKIRRDVYSMSVAQHGEGSLCSMQSGMNLYHELAAAHLEMEAQRLLSKMAGVSHRIHGEDHDITKLIKSKLQLLNRRCADIE